MDRTVQVQGAVGIHAVADIEDIAQYGEEMFLNTPDQIAIHIGGVGRVE